MTTYLAFMRDMIREAREDFDMRAAPLLVEADSSIIDFAVSVRTAIGEISTDEAIDALKRYKVGYAPSP